jgi:hypothetical protein
MSDAAARFSWSACAVAVRRWRLAHFAALCRLKLAEGGLLLSDDCAEGGDVNLGGGGGGDHRVSDDGEEGEARGGGEEEEGEEGEEGEEDIGVIALVVRAVHATHTAKHGHSAALFALREEHATVSAALAGREAELQDVRGTVQQLREEHGVVSERERRLEATVTEEVCTVRPVVVSTVRPVVVVSTVCPLVSTNTKTPSCVREGRQVVVDVQ